MNAAKRRSVPGGLSHSLGRWLPRPPAIRVGWLVGAAAVILIAAGAVSTWRKFRPQLLGRPEYRLTEQSLIVTSQPDWIDPGTDVKLEVIRDGSLLNLNLLDEQAAVKIARAFELHTWVRRVARVRKRAPASVEVELEYRRPVALVEVVFNKILSYEPVDADGVVLPEEMFHRDSSQLDNYPRITSDYSMPTGPLGTVWNDERIVGGAHIAALLEKSWRDWNLYRIVATVSDNLDRKPLFELRSRGHSRVVWGHRPGEEVKGEPAALQKVAWLAEQVRRDGPLDQGGRGPVIVDLSDLSGIQIREAPKESSQPDSM